MSPVSESRAFSHLALVVVDLDAMAAFYVTAFGFERGEAYASAGRRVAGLMECAPTGFRGVFLRKGDLLLELLAYVDGVAPPAVPRPAAQRGFAHISFLVDDIAAAVEAVQRAGGSLRSRLEHRFVATQEATDQTGMVMCLDPEGNRIELIVHPSPAEASAHGAYLGLARVGWPAVERVAPRQSRDGIPPE